MTIYDIETEYGKAYKFNKETSFTKEQAEKFLVNSQDNESIYFDKGYHRVMGWTFLPKGYQKFLVKYAYSLRSGFDYMEIFAIIPEPDTFKTPLKVPKRADLLPLTTTRRITRKTS